MNFNTRYAIHQSQFKTFDTAQLREAFLIDSVFIADDIVIEYTHYDRYIVGGANPVSKPLKLETPEALKASFFLQRREMGIINIGGSGIVRVDGTPYSIGNKEALYIGMGAQEVIFEPGVENPLYYINAAPAHHPYPTRKVGAQEADIVEIGSAATSNHRIIRKLLVNSVLPTCQLQMGLTELKIGSVWNTMPAHTHDRRMEAYFYFDIPNHQSVCHFIGEPHETRHLWMNNHQVALSPPWSIHSGAGTSNYSFIWGMAGENLDYSDMDIIQPDELR